MFVSVLEVSGDLFGERQKQLWKRDILKMPGTDKGMKDQGCNFHYKNIQREREREREREVE